MKRLVTSLIAVALLAGIGFSDRCYAVESFDFVSRDSGEVLAVLELSGLPATHESVDRLTFTPAWSPLYNVVPGLYPRDFDSTTTGTVDLLADGTLGCVECASDSGNSFLDTPFVGEPGRETGTVTLYFATEFPDFIRVAQAGSGVTGTVSGSWVPSVPEPNSLWLLGLAAGAWLGRRR